jgi:tetratricopeptide (TPR) repeat protein
LCLLCFFAAILSKTVTCTLPAVIVLLLWWKRSDKSHLKRDALMLAPMFAVALVFAKITGGMENWNVGARGPEFNFSIAERALIAGRAFWFYAVKLVFPANLAFIYPRWNIDPHSARQWIFPIAVIMAIGLLWALRNRIGRGPIIAILFFIGTLFPALGFVNVYPMRFSFVADHFQYLASIGVIALIASLLARVAIPTAARVAASAILLAGLGCITFMQAMAYHDARTIWLDTLKKNPNCWLAMDNLGGEAEERGNVAGAFDWYGKSLAVNPMQREAHWSRGRLFEREGKWDAAAAEFSAAATIRPDDTVVADHEMAKLLVARGDLAGGAAAYESALAEEPKLEPARLEYATLLRRLNRPQEAQKQYRTALELNPDSVGARSGLAGMAFIAGDLTEALRLMSEAIDIDPSDPKLCNNYGVFLMQAGRANEAAEQFASAIAADPQFPEAYDGLGNALQAQGNVNDAARMYRKALALKPDFAQARQHLENLQGK